MTTIELVDFGDFVLAPLAYTAFTQPIKVFEPEEDVEVKVSGLYVDKRPPLSWIKECFGEGMLRGNQGLKEILGDAVDEFLYLIDRKIFGTQFKNNREFREGFFHDVFDPLHNGIIEILSQDRDQYMKKIGKPSNNLKPTQFPSDPNADYHIAVDESIVPYANGTGLSGKVRQIGRSFGYGNPRVQTMREASGSSIIVIVNPMAGLETMLGSLGKQLGRPELFDQAKERLDKLGLTRRGRYDFFDQRYQTMCIHGGTLIQKISGKGPQESILNRRN